MSFTDRRRTGELEPLVSVVDDVAETADTADSLEISVAWRRPYANNDRFRPRASAGSLPRSGSDLSGVGVSASMSTGCTVTDGRVGLEGSWR